jgi:hypothetical protein
LLEWLSSKLKPSSAPDDWASTIRWRYKFLGIPEKGYVYYKQKKLYYEMVNGLVDLYTVGEKSTKFLETVTYTLFRDVYLSNGQKIL